MIQCPNCSAENSDDSRFCKSCGQELSSLSQAPTVAAPDGEALQAQAQSPHVGRIVSSDSVPAGGFTPGTILADRYRIIGLLGRGGMGEVYRADDLKLGQPVALKFLPPALAQDSVRRERFFAEVRITRQLSHPNICRVYDIGEVDGRHFLSMEYIDGEDLASLMKRIGHLSNEKALDIARQLVAGLSVAHERGVLHRDLKPANIMLDGHGRVRITDFGLAIAVGDESQAEEIAGTPAYMAPEQLAGKGATVRSDIYSLGLILYEIYTGKKAFKAKTLAELREQKETQTPRAPSELRDGIDPVVERVIQRCMEKDPNARPGSVAQLAQALPGGDPLAAAIAAGETPSPEMVAASGSKEGLKPAIAWGLLGLITVGTLAIIIMKDRSFVFQKMYSIKSADVLVDTAREIIREAGYSEKFRDSVHGFIVNTDLLESPKNTGNSEKKLKKQDDNVLLFFYRQSKHPFDISLSYRMRPGKVAMRFEYENLPLKYSGDILVVLDTEGRLIFFCAMPQQVLSSFENTPPFDWRILFKQAGIDISQWEETKTRKNPLTYADTLVAWNPHPDRSGVYNRIEAASFKGKPVSFEIQGLWNGYDEEEIGSSQSVKKEQIQNIATSVFMTIILIGGLLFARQNLRLGRGDRRSAIRLAILTGIMLMFRMVLQTEHTLTLLEIREFISDALFYACLAWILYIALEPYVRRRWPKVLVSWTRLLSGDWIDTLVAGDVLIGCTIGVVLGTIFCFFTSLGPSVFGYQDIAVSLIVGPEMTATGGFGMLSIYAYGLIAIIFVYVGLLGILCFFRAVIRIQTFAAIVFILFGSVMFSGLDLVESLFILPIFVLMYFILMRFGLLTAISMTIVSVFITQFPITFNTTAWYRNYGYVALIIFSAIVLYAFRTSLGGRPMFGTSRLDD